MDETDPGGSLSASRAIVAALKALQKRLDDVEATRRIEAEKAKERLDAKSRELAQALLRIESLQSEFDLDKNRLKQEIMDITQQRDQAFADLAVCKHTIHTLRDELRLAKSVIAAVPASSPKPVNVTRVSDSAQTKPPSERNVEIVLPSVQPTEIISPSVQPIEIILPSVLPTESAPLPKTEPKNDELERLVHNLLQMNSKLKEERDSVRKQLKLKLGAPRAIVPATSVPSFAQPRAKRRTTSTKLSQSKTKENRDPVIKTEPELLGKKASKPKKRPEEIKATESKLRWIQHCIDEIAKNDGINLRTGSSRPKSVSSRRGT